MGWFILTPGVKYQHPAVTMGWSILTPGLKYQHTDSYNGMVYFNTWSKISEHGQLQWGGLF